MLALLEESHIERAAENHRSSIITFLLAHNARKRIDICKSGAELQN